MSTDYIRTTMVIDETYSSLPTDVSSKHQQCFRITFDRRIGDDGAEEFVPRIERRTPQ